jgi:hypothetical protein
MCFMPPIWFECHMFQVYSGRINNQWDLV